MADFLSTLSASLLPLLASRHFCAQSADEMATVIIELMQTTLAESGQVIVPVEATEGLLNSMALRYDHIFGVDQLEMTIGDRTMVVGYTPEMRESLRRTMRQLHEEVVGTGFYRVEREKLYQESGGSAKPDPSEG